MLENFFKGKYKRMGRLLCGRDRAQGSSGETAEDEVSSKFCPKARGVRMQEEVACVRMGGGGEGI